jgi:hypothetical protein
MSGLLVKDQDPSKFLVQTNGDNAPEVRSTYRELINETKTDINLLLRVLRLGDALILHNLKNMNFLARNTLYNSQKD